MPSGKYGVLCPLHLASPRPQLAATLFHSIACTACSCCRRDHADAAGRGQEHDHCRTVSGTGRIPQTQGKRADRKSTKRIDRLLASSPAEHTSCERQYGSCASSVHARPRQHEHAQTSSCIFGLCLQDLTLCCCPWSGGHLHPTAKPRPNLWHQGRGGWRRL